MVINIFELKKFKVPEIILRNRNAGFNTLRVALMRQLPELSWEEIMKYIALLKNEGYVATDNELCAVAPKRLARTRLQDLHEATDSEKLKILLGRILTLFKINLWFSRFYARFAQQFGLNFHSTVVKSRKVNV